MSNESVVRNWLDGIPCCATHGGQLHTDGNRLFSYAMPIAQRHQDTVYLVLRTPTVTTARHRSLALREVDRRRLVVVSVESL